MNRLIILKLIMKRQQLNFPPPTQQIKFLHNPNTQIYSDYGYPVVNSELKKSNESQLIIFNGNQQERDIYNFNQRSQGTLISQQTPKIIKSNSQKSFPIIYNAYNDHRNQYPSPKRDTDQQLYAPRQLPKQYMKIQNQQQNYDMNHSDVFQYDHYQPKQIQKNQIENNQFVTFKCFPDIQPQTAHFIPENLPNQNDNRSIPLRKIPSIHQEILTSTGQNKQYVPVQQERNFALSQPIHQIQPISRPQSSAGVINILPPPSPRLRLENSYQNAHTLPDQTPKFIQVPQQQYQKFIDHLPLCQKNHDQIMQLKSKNEELGQKEHFYWQQNTTLREENKRLRDLVTHFQKRQKQLLSQREQFKNSLLANINRYQQSTLEQFSLLIERYRLELQRKKK